MKLRRVGWLRVTTFTTIIFGMLAARPQTLKADENQIFGLIGGLGCQGATNSPFFQGFAASTFSLSDKHAVSAKPIFPDISVVKGLDDCTPLLFGAVATGKTFAEATLSIVPKGSRTALVVIQLRNVMVTSDNFTEGAANELDEVVTLTYTRITITHVPSGKSFTIDLGNPLT